MYWQMKKDIDTSTGGSGMNLEYKGAYFPKSDHQDDVDILFIDDSDDDYDTVSNVNDGRPPMRWDEITLPDYASIVFKIDACKQAGGEWLSKYNECDLLTTYLDNMELFCTKTLNGTYNDCASDCRHEIKPQGCIEICVPVCSL